MIEINGKNYVKVGNKLVEVNHFDAAGRPVISVWSEEKKNSAGGMDCTVHIPCLRIAGESKSPGK